MDPFALIRDAWMTTWQTRRLWLFGLLAGVTAGSLSIGRTSLPTSLTDLLPPLPTVFELSTLIVAAALAAVLLVISAVARAAITQATLELERGEGADAAGMLHAGARWFWRFLGLLVLLGLGGAAVVGLAALAAISLGTIGAVLSAVVMTVGVVASIVLTYAERATIAYDLAPRAALSHGWRLFQSRPGSSLLIWMLNVCLAFAAALLAMIGLGTLLMFVDGLGVLTLLLLGAALLLMAAIANTFFWSYWTLAYVRLEAARTTALP